MRGAYRAIAFMTLLGLLVGACGPEPTPFPTPPPYTPPSVGIVPVVVIQRTPEPGEELPPDGFIELVFDREMDRASVEAALTGDPRLVYQALCYDPLTAAVLSLAEIKKTPFAEAWIDADDPKIQSGPAENTAYWWTVFDDPVLNALIETASQQNPPLKIAGPKS